MSWIPTYTGPGPTKVGGLGDSIMAMTADDLAIVNTASPFQFTYACWSGVKLSDIVAFNWHTDLAASNPKHVVVIAGTNDCFVADSAWGMGTLAAQAAVIGAFPATTQIHFVKVYANPPTQPPGCSLQAHIVGWNSAIANQAAAHANVHVVDWPLAVYYTAVQGGVVLQNDGVHPTAGGQTLLANIVNNSIASNP